MQFRKKLSERDIAKLNEYEIRKIERVNGALMRSEQAEANKESEQKLRILFTRAPEETLPFLVYCIWVAAAGLTSFFYLISKFEGNLLYVLLGVLLVLVCSPLLVLPKLNIKKIFSWIFSVKKTKKENRSELRL